MSLLSAVLEAEAKARASIIPSKTLETIDTALKSIKIVENGNSVVENGTRTAIVVGAMAATESLATDAIETLTARYVRVSGTASTKIPSSELLTKRRQQLLETGTSPHHEVALRLEAAATACEWSDRAQHASRLLERRKWKSAAEKLRSLASDLDMPCNQFIPESLVRGIREFVSTKRARCLAHVTAQWKSIFKWSATLEVIVLRINVSDRENLLEILNALYVSERIDAEIAKFADFFLNSVVPALVFKKSSLRVDDELGVIRIEIRTGERIDETDEISGVVDSLVMFFETVQSNIDCKWEDYRTVFSIFGQIAAEDFFNSFVDRFLEDRVSIDSRSAKECLRTANEIEKFGNYLCEIGFVEQETNPLLEYTAKYYDFIYDKKCERLLCTARNTTKYNLQKEVVKVCEGQTFEIDTNEIKIFEREVNDRNLLFFPFMMSECSISNGARSLLELIFSELETVQNLSLKFGNKLVLTLKNIFELYYMLVPQFHNEALKSDPLDLGK